MMATEIATRSPTPAALTVPLRRAATVSSISVKAAMMATSRTEMDVGPHVSSQAYAETATSIRVRSVTTEITSTGTDVIIIVDSQGAATTSWTPRPKNVTMAMPWTMAMVALSFAWPTTYVATG